MHVRIQIDDTLHPKKTISEEASAVPAKPYDKIVQKREHGEELTDKQTIAH